MHLPKAVAASWRMREADMLNAADECPPLGGKADMDQPLLQNSIMSTRPNARLIETVWTDRAREAFSAACSEDLPCGVVEADHGASASPQT